MIARLWCQFGNSSRFVHVRAEWSRAGELSIRRVVDDDSEHKVDLTQSGTTVTEPKSKRDGRPFCISVIAVDPDGAKRKFTLDTGSALEQQRWLRPLRQVATQEDSTKHRDYIYSIQVRNPRAGARDLEQFTIRYRNAKTVHESMQQSGVVRG
eukprot:COSAG02_NODE_21900_length_771_cov_0.513393_1_plen_152_part_01